MGKNKMAGDGSSKVFGWIRSNEQKAIQYLGLVLVIIIFAVLTNGSIFSADNIETLIRQLVVMLTIALGMAFIYAHGGMDISVGAVVALNSMCATFVMNRTGGNVIFGLLTSIAVSVVCYLINVGITNRFGLMSVISSLAVMFVARGIVTYVNSINTDSRIAVEKAENLEMFRSNIYFILGTMVVLSLIMAVIFNLTKIGKQNRAIGDNPLAAMESGVQIRQVKVTTYIIAGVMVGIASVFALSRSGSVSEKTGSGLEIDAMVALILGGMSLNGGSDSRISSAVIGSLTYILLNKGLIMAGVDTQVVSLIKGIIFLVVVFITVRQPKSQKVLPR